MSSPATLPAAWGVAVAAIGLTADADPGSCAAMVEPIAWSWAAFIVARLGSALGLVESGEAASGEAESGASAAGGSVVDASAGGALGASAGVVTVGAGVVVGAAAVGTGVEVTVPPDNGVVSGADVAAAAGRPPLATSAVDSTSAAVTPRPKDDRLRVEVSASRTDLSRFEEK